MAQEYNNPKEKSAQQVQPFALEQQVAPTQLPVPEPGATMENPAPRAATDQISHGLGHVIPQQSVTVQIHGHEADKVQDQRKRPIEDQDAKVGEKESKRQKREEQSEAEQYQQRLDHVTQERSAGMQASEAMQFEEQETDEDQDSFPELQDTFSHEILRRETCTVLSQSHFCRLGWPDADMRASLVQGGEFDLYWLQTDVFTDDEKTVLLSRLGAVTPEVKAMYDQLHNVLRTAIGTHLQEDNTVSDELKEKIEFMKAHQTEAKQIQKLKTWQDIGLKDFKSILVSRYKFIEEKYGEKLCRLKKASILELSFHTAMLDNDFIDADKEILYLRDFPGLIDNENEDDKKLMNLIQMVADYYYRRQYGDDTWMRVGNAMTLQKKVGMTRKQWGTMMAVEAESGINWKADYQRPEELLTPLQPGEPDYVSLAEQERNSTHAAGMRSTSKG